VSGTGGHPTIFATINFAAAIHAGQYDLAGVPYIAHPLMVMRNVSEDARHVAVLHDVLEDSGITADDLRRRGYATEEIAAVVLLTRQPPYEYEPYIEAIATSSNRLAIEVKIADLTDNLDAGRLSAWTEADRQREHRYSAALRRLKESR